MSFRKPTAITPGGRGHEEINQYLNDLAQLGFPVAPRGLDYSPSSSASKNHCVDLVKWIYWKQKNYPGPDLLETLINTAKAYPKSVRTYDSLHQQLKDSQSQINKVVTSTSSALRQTAQNGFNSNLSYVEQKFRHGGKRSFGEYSPEGDEDSGEDFETAPGSPSPSHRTPYTGSGSPSAKFTRASNGMTPRKSVGYGKGINVAETAGDTSFSSTATAGAFRSFVSSFNPLNRSMRSDTTEVTIPDEEPPPSEHSKSAPASSQLYAISDSIEQAFANCLPSKPASASVRMSNDSAAMYSLDLDTLQEAGKLMAPMETSKAPVKSVLGYRKRENWRVRDLPSKGFFVDDIIVPKSNFGLRFECFRVYAETHDTALLENKINNDYDKFYRDYPNSRCSRRAWSLVCGQNPSPEQAICLKGSLAYTKPSSKNELFKLSLDPLSVEKTCRLQRKFGGDRFLSIDIPAFSKAPYDRDTVGNIEERFLEWLMTEKLFLDRTWRAVYIEQNNKKPGINKTRDFQFRVIFFAIAGLDIETVTLYDFMTWFMPLNKENLSIPYAKAFARLSLGFSRASPTVGFQPSQVHSVKNIRANGAPESTEFNDLNFQWQPQISLEAMNDGCAEMSMSVFRQVWSKLGRIDSMPSVFQGRLNGAKGIWYRSAASDATDAKHLGTWIQVNESQRKFAPHSEDDDRSFDQDRFLLEVLNYSRRPKASVLYLSFVPILVDRGVPKATIAKLVADTLDQIRNEVIDATSNTHNLLDWLQRVRNPNRPEAPRADWALPNGITEKIVLLLSSGFQPKELGFFNQKLSELIQRYFTSMVRQLAVRLPQSTTVIGIADPSGTLLPGEIFLAFSHGFEVGDERISHLMGKVLVTRHPVIRNSDVQKVRAVYRPELSHLNNVVVFASAGCIPLASKLSGGDYDGDTFWICWDINIVKDFRNAPAPLELRSPKSFNIRVDRRPMNTFFNNSTNGELSVEKYIEAAFKFRLQPSLLGKVTIFHEQVAYTQNKISSPEIDQLADLHDHLVDDEKQGYSYTDEDYSAWKASIPGLRLRTRDPAYKQDKQMWLEKEHNENRSESKQASFSKMVLNTKDNTPRNSNHILDYLYFEIIKPHINETLTLLRSQLPKDVSLKDEHLLKHYAEEKLRAVSEGNEELQREFGRLESAIVQIKTGLQKDCRNGVPYTNSITAHYQKFLSIRPTNLENGAIAGLQWSLGAVPSRWEVLKASCLADSLKNKSQKNLFNIAGDTLCWIKACKAANPERPGFAAPDVFARFKFRKEKKIDGRVESYGLPGPERDDDDDDDDYGSFGADDEYESLFDEWYSAQESVFGGD